MSSMLRLPYRALHECRKLVLYEVKELKGVLKGSVLSPLALCSSSLFRFCNPQSIEECIAKVELESK